MLKLDHYLIYQLLLDELIHASILKLRVIKVDTGDCIALLCWVLESLKAAFLLDPLFTHFTYFIFVIYVFAV